MSAYDQIATIAREHQAAKVRGYLVDAFTASMVVQVHDAISVQNRARMVSMLDNRPSLPRVIDALWKVANGGK